VTDEIAEVKSSRKVRIGGLRCANYHDSLVLTRFTLINSVMLECERISTTDTRQMEGLAFRDSYSDEATNHFFMLLCSTH
jgi:hypothetical protein